MNLGRRRLYTILCASIRTREGIFQLYTDDYRCSWNSVPAIPTFREHPFKYSYFVLWLLVSKNRNKTTWLARQLPPLSCYCADHCQLCQPCQVPCLPLCRTEWGSVSQSRGVGYVLKLFIFYQNNLSSIYVFGFWYFYYSHFVRYWNQAGLSGDFECGGRDYFLRPWLVRKAGTLLTSLVPAVCYCQRFILTTVIFCLCYDSPVPFYFQVT